LWQSLELRDDGSPLWRRRCRAWTTQRRNKQCHREQLDDLAQALLERETLDEADAYAVAGVRRPAASAQPVPTHAKG